MNRTRLPKHLWVLFHHCRQFTELAEYILYTIFHIYCKQYYNQSIHVHTAYHHDMNSRCINNYVVRTFSGRVLKAATITRFSVYCIILSIFPNILYCIYCCGKTELYRFLVILPIIIHAICFLLSFHYIYCNVAKSYTSCHIWPH